MAPNFTTHSYASGFKRSQKPDSRFSSRIPSDFDPGPWPDFQCSRCGEWESERVQNLFDSGVDGYEITETFNVHRIGPSLKYKETTCPISDWDKKCVFRESGYGKGTCAHGGVKARHDWSRLVFYAGYWWKQPGAYKDSFSQDYYRHEEEDLPYDSEEDYMCGGCEPMFDPLPPLNVAQLAEALQRERWILEGVINLWKSKINVPWRRSLHRWIREIRERRRRRLEEERLEKERHERESLVLMLAFKWQDEQPLFNPVKQLEEFKILETHAGVANNPTIVESYAAGSGFTGIENPEVVIELEPSAEDEYAEMVDQLAEALRLFLEAPLTEEEVTEGEVVASLLEETTQQQDQGESLLEESTQQQNGMDRKIKHDSRRKAQRYKKKMLKETPVGGKNDCWKKLFMIDDVDDVHRSLGEVVQLLKVALDDKRPTRSVEVQCCENCYQCSKEDCVAGGCEEWCPMEAPEEEDFEDHYKTYWIDLSWYTLGRLHIGGYRFSSATPENTKGFVTFYDLMMALEKRDGKFFSRLPGYSKWFKWVPLEGVYADLAVGSAVDAVAESLRLNGPEMARSIAQVQFNDDFNSVTKTHIRMDGKMTRFMTNYLGHPIISTQSKNSTNDHLPLEICNGLINKKLEARFPHNSDAHTVLHVGATMREVRMWYSHPGHDFYFHLGEDKDISRMYEELVAWIKLRLDGMKIPSLASRKGNDVVLNFQSFGEAFNVLTAGSRQRFFFRKPERKYGILILQHCMYDMLPSEFCALMNDTGAKVAYSTMFFPDVMIEPTALPAEFYKYEEYLPVVEQVEDFIEQFWPEILAVTPSIPVGIVNGVIHKILKTCLTVGWKVFVGWMKGLITDDFPAELLVGNLLDLAKFEAIYKGFMKHIKPLIRKYFLRSRITWTGGFSNGYDHSTYNWDYWLRQRRIENEDTKSYLDSEIIDREGETYLLRFYPSSGVSPIVNTLDIPLEKETVMVLDLSSGWDTGGKTMKEFKYFPILTKDWFALINWGLGEPPDALNVAVLVTMVNRVFGGLSLSSNVLVEEMSFKSDKVVAVAVAVLMEVYRMHGVLEDIENSKELRDLYASNLKMLTEKVVKFGVILASGGLAIPMFFLYKWLITAIPTIEFVKYRERPKVETFARKKLNYEGVLREMEKTKVSVVVRHKDSPVDKPCTVCELHDKGEFAVGRIMADGQDFVCTNHSHDNTVDFSFTGPEVAEFITVVRGAEEFHRGKAGPAFMAALNDFKHWLEANVNGINHEVKLTTFSGGPGTGKSVCIRVLANYFNNRGLDTVIGVPFTELTEDFTNCEVLNVAERVDLQAHTLWNVCRTKSAKVSIWDEATGVDGRLVKAYAAFSGAKHVLLFGDRQQTELRGEGGEGWNLYHERFNIPWDRVPNHELVKNYRLDPWRVKYLNHTRGYHMICAKPREDLPPKFISKKQFNEMREKPERIMVFAHATADPIFGMISMAGALPGSGVVNLSVRSSQGKTFDTAAVSCSEMDSGVWNAHGMMCVAISRSRGQTYFVTETDAKDGMEKLFREHLYLDTPERIKEISKLPWPKLEQKKKQRELTYEEKKIDEKIQEMAKFTDVVEILKHPTQEDDTEKGTVGKRKTRRLQLDWKAQEVWDPASPFMEMLNMTFNVCFFDAIEGCFNAEKFGKVKYAYLLTIYEDDELMGRVNTPIALPVVDGKRVLPLKTSNTYVAGCMDFVGKYLGPVLVWENGKPMYVSGNYRSKTIANVLLHKNHISKMDVPKLKVKWSNVKDVVEVDATEMWKGEPIWRYVVDKNKVRNIDVTGVEFFGPSLEGLRKHRMNQKKEDFMCKILGKVNEKGEIVVPVSVEIEVNIGNEVLVDCTSIPLPDTPKSLPSRPDSPESIVSIELDPDPPISVNLETHAGDANNPTEVESYAAGSGFEVSDDVSVDISVEKDIDLQILVLPKTVEVSLDDAVRPAGLCAIDAQPDGARFSDKQWEDHFGKDRFKKGWFRSDEVADFFDKKQLNFRVVNSDGTYQYPVGRDHLANRTVDFVTYSFSGPLERGHWHSGVLDRNVKVNYICRHGKFKCPKDCGCPCGCAWSFINTDVVVGVVTHEPTISRVTIPSKMSRQDVAYATRHAPLLSSWKMNKRPHEDSQEIPRRTKFRCGTDGFRLGEFIDPSNACTKWPVLNSYGPVKGVVEPTRKVLTIPGFIFDRTAGGKLKLRKPKVKFCQAPGMANHYNNSPEETLLAAQRLSAFTVKPKLNSETKKFAEKVAEKLYRDCWLPKYRLGHEEANAAIENALKDSSTRNYPARRKVELAKTFGKPRLTLSNKDQQKPIKNGKLDLFKAGQPILQSPPQVNDEFIAHFRVKGRTFKESVQEDVFIDDYETRTEFRKRCTKSIARLPNSVRIGISDAWKFDGQQGPVSLHIEKHFAALTGSHSESIRQYYHIRGNIDYIMFGMFKGKTAGEKGSGFLDTKIGNTTLSMALSNYIFEGIGPKVVAAKGDDYLRIQSGLKADPGRVKEVKAMTGMVFTLEIGNGGEFIGDSVSRAGMYPSITRAAMKARAKPARDWKNFCEHAVEYRKSVKEWLDVGLEECINYSALAEGKNANYVRACLCYINSMGHINEKQFRSIFKPTPAPRYYLNKACGPTLL